MNTGTGNRIFRQCYIWAKLQLSVYLDSKNISLIVFTIIYDQFNFTTFIKFIASFNLLYLRLFITNLRRYYKSLAF